MAERYVPRSSFYIDTKQYWIVVLEIIGSRACFYLASMKSLLPEINQYISIAKAVVEGKT